MNKTIQDALQLVDFNIPINTFLFNLLLAAFLSIILKYVYEKYGEEANSIINRFPFRL